MKHCPRCDRNKPPSEYYLTAKGGLMHICKSCHKAAMKINRLTNPHVQEYERERARRPDRKSRTAKVSALWRDTHPDAYRAQTAVNNAVRDRRLAKSPCVICGTTKRVHGHHKDYSKPLDVIWMCARCHHRMHSAFPELGGHHAPEFR